MLFDINSCKKDLIVSRARLWRLPWVLSGGGDAVSCVWPGEFGLEGSGDHTQSTVAWAVAGVTLGHRARGDRSETTKSRWGEGETRVALWAPGPWGRGMGAWGFRQGAFCACRRSAASCRSNRSPPGFNRCHPFKGSEGLHRLPCALFWAPFLDAWKGLTGPQ